MPNDISQDAVKSASPVRMNHASAGDVDVVIIGAGAAGITAAYELTKRGKRVAVYEAAPQVGGLARTIDLWGQRVDLGPHRFFSSDARVNRLWLEVVGRDYAMVDRLTRVYYRRRFFQYPLRPVDAFLKLGPVETVRCMFSYVFGRGTRADSAPAAAATGTAAKGAAVSNGGSVAPAVPAAAAGNASASGTPQASESFETWVVSRFGRRLFEIFFKTYSEKLWGITCQELDADFAAQRIKKLSLWEAVKNAILPRGGNKHKTLVDRFAYPHEGTGAVYERMAARVRAAGSEVHVGAPVRRILHDGVRRVTGVELMDGTVVRAPHVISTMPLTLMVKSLGDVPAQVQRANEQLTFRNTTLVYLHVEGAGLFPDQWLYVHAPEMLLGRITNFRNWVPQLFGEEKNTILTLEYWSYDTDQLWKDSDEDLIARGEREMRDTGLLGGAKVLGGYVFRIPRCYPVYRRGYREHLDTVVKHLETFQGLTPIGRYGAFKYNNQDHSILMGILAAEKIADGSTADIWSVNTDYESYQEAAVIDETGLQPA